eukprot:SAG11_NODE_18758_length_482_cov_0.723238_1_plen_68_part_01
MCLPLLCLPLVCLPLLCPPLLRRPPADSSQIFVAADGDPAKELGADEFCAFMRERLSPTAMHFHAAAE